MSGMHFFRMPMSFCWENENCDRIMISILREKIHILARIAQSQLVLSVCVCGTYLGPKHMQRLAR